MSRYISPLLATARRRNRGVAAVTEMLHDDDGRLVGASRAPVDALGTCFDTVWITPSTSRVLPEALKLPRANQS